MKINPITNFQKKMKQIVSLLVVFLLPFLSNAQQIGCAIESYVIGDLCWDPVAPSGTFTIEAPAATAYNYQIDASDGSSSFDVDAVEFPAGSGNFINNLGDSVFTLTPGTYYIYVQEAMSIGCVSYDTVTILNPQDSITVVTDVTTPVLCHSDSTGQAEVHAIGGVLPYTYFWPSINSTDSVVYNLWYGYHTVIVTDSYGCEKIDSVFIDRQNPPFNIVLDTLQQVQCNGGSDGAVVLNVTGGTGNYEFAWSYNNITNLGPGPDTLSGLPYGSYNVIVSDNPIGCDTVVSFTIDEPTQLYAIANSIQPVQCFGFDDGEAYAFGSGGAVIGPPYNPNDYTYSWSVIENFNTASQDTVSTGVINDTTISLTPDIHIVTVTDTNGCTATDTVLITEPDQLYVEIPDSTAVFPYCLNTFPGSGSLIAQAYGGSPLPGGIYNYSWIGTPQTAASAVNLNAGIYTVTVFDARSCVADTSFNLDSITNTFIEDSVIFTLNNVSCWGDYDGSISINTISGSDYGPYDFTWNGPSSYSSTNNGFSSSITDLYWGDYAVAIEDTLGCKINMNINISQPDKLEYSIDYIVDETCVGTLGSSCDGSAVVSVNGGTSPYYYDITSTGTFNDIVIQDTLISDLCNGIYIIDITDVNQCQGFVYTGGVYQANIGSSVQVYNNAVNPSAPVTSCFNSADGSTQVSLPNSMFNYTWEAGTSILDTGISYHYFEPGDYTLVAHYADSASFGINYAACDVPLDFTVFPGNSITSGAFITNATCYGDTDGAIDLTPTGDVALVSILWDTLSSIPVSNYTLEDQSQLAAGIYTVSITDADGCILIESFTVNEPNPITATFVNVKDVSCHGLADGSAKVQVDPNSGHGDFVYVWNTMPPQFTPNATGLDGGVHIVTVTDSAGNGCSVDFSVTIVDPPSLLASVEPNSFFGEDDLGNPFHISCYGYSDGSIIVGSVGGTGSVSFDWQDSNGQTVSSTELADNLSAGSYTLYAVDDELCDTSIIVTLNQPDIILPNVTVSFYDFNADNIGTEVSCFGLFDGWALSTPTGGYPGVQGYLYSWVNSNGQNISSENLVENLPALLSYTVTVSDMNGCSQPETTVSFTQPLLFDANVTTTNYPGPTHAPFIVNFIDNTNSLDPYNYSWSWDDGMNDMNLEFGTEHIGTNEVYIVLSNTVTGCNDTVFFDIDIQGIPEIKNVFTPNSDGINDEFSFGEFGMNAISVEVYNRWGQMVYTWTGENKSWRGVDISGEAVPEGVYFYVLEAEGEDGYYYDYKGSVTLLR